MVSVGQFNLVAFSYNFTDSFSLMTFLDILTRGVVGRSSGSKKENTASAINRAPPYQHPLYAISTRSVDDKIAVGTFIRGSNDNYISIEGRKYHHRLPPSKILWSCNALDVFASTSSSLRIWRVSNMEKPEMKLHTSSKTGNGTTSGAAPSPITCMDWNACNPGKIATCHVDTTVAIWDITKGKLDTQLIAHDKSVLDVAFCGKSNPSIFASVSEDGSLRIFDTRDLDHSTIAYEDSNPILRLRWNQIKTNLVACIVSESPDILFFDMRKPGQVFNRIAASDPGVVPNAICWNSTFGSHLAAGLSNGNVASINIETGAVVHFPVSGATEVVNVEWNFRDSESVVAIHGTHASVIKLVAAK